MTIEIDVPATEEPEQFIVKGQIRTADKRPLVNGVVRAFDRDLRQEQPLGEITADGEECYQTAYTRARFRRTEKKWADLLVRVYDPKATSLLLGESDISKPTSSILKHICQGGLVPAPSQQPWLSAGLYEEELFASTLGVLGRPVYNSHRFVRALPLLGVCGMAGGYSNPFFHRGPIRQQEYFFGRNDHIGQSLSLLRNGQNVALLGQRRIGKTSLLFHIADPVVFEAHGLHRGEHLFVYLDGTELGDLGPDEVLGLLLDQLAATLPDAGQSFGLRQPPASGLSYRSFREAILKVTEADLKPIYLFDEFESLAANPYLGPRFFSGLRALSNQFDLSIVTASRESLLRLTYANAETLSSPFFNTFANLRLGLFSESEARGLVETLVTYASLDLPSQLVERTLELAGPHPLLLQIAAFHAVELWVQEGWPGEEAASLRAEWRRRFMAEAESHFEYYWRHLTDDDRYALATLPLSQQGEAQREAIRRLEQACLIRRNEQGYAYLSPAFEEFVRRQSVLQLLQLGPFLLDLPRQVALCHDAPFKVTKTEFKALAHLIRHAGQVVTPEELEKALWEDEYVEDPERVRAVIKSLRKALGDEADCLVTKWGVGYLFQVSS